MTRTNDTNDKGTTMNATVTQLHKGDMLRITTTTAGPETLRLISSVRRDGTQYVYLASEDACAAIRSGETTPEICVLTGLHRVRKMETQYLYSLMARGFAVKV